MGDRIGLYGVLVGKTEGKRTLGILWFRCSYILNFNEKGALIKIDYFA
jgi:hypothetical protein